MLKPALWDRYLSMANFLWGCQITLIPFLSLLLNGSHFTFQCLSLSVISSLSPLINVKFSFLHTSVDTVISSFNYLCGLPIGLSPEVVALYYTGFGILLFVITCLNHLSWYLYVSAFNFTWFLSLLWCLFCQVILIHEIILIYNPDFI